MAQQSLGAFVADRATASSACYIAPTGGEVSKELSKRKKQLAAAILQNEPTAVLARAHQVCRSIIGVWARKITHRRVDGSAWRVPIDGVEHLL